jgi:hypothetical protein
MQSRASGRVTQGLDVGGIDFLLHVRPCEGLVRRTDGSVQKRFATKELRWPLQVHGRHRNQGFALGPVWHAEQDMRTVFVSQ